MARSLLSLACILLATGAWSEDVPATPTYNEKFTTGLMKELAESGDNLVFSPLSIDSAMGIVGFGARDDTMKEIFEVLGYPVNEAKHLMAEKQKMLSEEPAPGATWQIANRIMVDKSLPVKDDYKKEVTEAFPGVGIGTFSFAKRAAVAKEVNAWAAENTKNVINKLLNEDDIEERTKLIVLNAIYFKGEWKHGFDKRATIKECFFSEPGQCTMTDMMHVMQRFKYGYDSNMLAEIIEFPYKNEDFSMVIVLPDERKRNLTSLISNLDVDAILSFIDMRPLHKVVVTFPKFEIEFKSELKPALMNLGMKHVFSQTSDLSGMVAGIRAQVNKVIQKAKITCDEEGTVAAVVTAGTVNTYSAFQISTTFVANHPFVYFLRSKHSGVVFAGQMKHFK